MAFYNACGTDLVGVLKANLLPEYPEQVVSIQHIPGLDGIHVEHDGLYIGAAATITDISAYMEQVRAGEMDKAARIIMEVNPMPANAEEIERALEENAEILNGWGPKQVLKTGGKVSGIEFKRCTRVLDETGRFSPARGRNTGCTAPAV